jgi:hypothetical protein
VIGVLFVGMFLAVLAAYFCTEFLLNRLDARRRVLGDRGHPLLLILAAHLVSFVVLLASGALVVLVSDSDYYGMAVIVCACAQAVWLAQHLWSYYRDHPRLRYEN